MQKLLKSGALLLILCLSGCTPPKKIVVERCIPSIEFGETRCHDYEISDEKIERVSESRTEALGYINNQVCFSDYKQVYLFLEEWRIYLNDRDRSKLDNSLLEDLK